MIFRVWGLGLGFGVGDLGFRVQVLQLVFRFSSFRVSVGVWGPMCRAWGSGFSGWELDGGCSVYASGFGTSEVRVSD